MKERRLFHTHHTMHRTFARMPPEPITDTLSMESAQALQTRHADTDLEFLQANGALGVVHAVLFGSLVGEHACESLGRRAGAGERRIDDGSMSALAGSAAGFGGVEDGLLG